MIENERITYNFNYVNKLNMLKGFQNMCTCIVILISYYINMD